MDFKKLIFPVFILMVCVQLYVPTKMIFDKEKVIENGVIYKFNTVPVDPTDLFRGKYVRLRFRDDRIDVTHYNSSYQAGDKVYLTFTTDAEGYAKPVSLHSEPPTTNIYLTTTVGFRYKDEIRLNYPFDRFYMEESKAYPAEMLYRRMARDTTKSTYAVVSIKNGDAVLLDVEIEGVSIKDLVEKEAKMTN